MRRNANKVLEILAKAKGTRTTLTREQQEALWLPPVALAGLSAGTAAAVTIGSSSFTEHRVTPEVARWAKPIVDLIQKASTLSRDDQYEEAIEIYKQVLEKAPDAAIALMSIGCCYGHTGRKSDARGWLERAAKAEPTNERIRRNLEGLKRM